MHFLESNGLLPCTQQTINGPFYQMNEFSPHLPTIFLQDAF